MSTQTYYHYYFDFGPGSPSEPAAVRFMVVIGADTRSVVAWAESKLRARFPAQHLQCAYEGMTVGPLTADEVQRMEAELVSQSTPADQNVYRVQRRINAHLVEGSTVLRHILRVTG